MYHIYVIQNIETDWFYVGQTKRPDARERTHRYELRRGKHKNPHLQRSWTSRGEQAFEWYFIAVFPSREEADEAEMFYISWFKAIGRCYNNVDGGQGLRNPSPETRLKMRLAKLGKPQSEAQKAKYKGRPSPRKGVVVSAEARAKMSAAKKGKPGRRLSEEEKRALSENRRGENNPYHRSRRGGWWKCGQQPEDW